MSRGTLDPAQPCQTSDTGLSPSSAGCPKAVLLSSTDLLMQSEPRGACTAVWALPRSLAATYGIDVSFSSSGYLDVSVPRVPLRTLWIHVRMTVVRTAGFPHSDISGSMDMCSSPKLFAAYHVFHRLSVPRHPPCALFCLTSLIPCLSFLPDRKGGLPPCRPSVSGGRLHVDTCFFMVRVSPNLELAFVLGESACLLYRKHSEFFDVVFSWNH